MHWLTRCAALVLPACQALRRSPAPGWRTTGQRADAIAAELAVAAPVSRCRPSASGSHRRRRRAGEQESGLGALAVVDASHPAGRGSTTLCSRTSRPQSEQGGGLSGAGGWHRGRQQAPRSRRTRPKTRPWRTWRRTSIAVLDADKKLRAEWEQERVGFVEQARERDAENARLRDQLAEQAPQLREQDEAVAAAVAAAQKEAGATTGESAQRLAH